MFEWIIIIGVTLAACAATPSKGSRTAGRSRAARSRTLTLKAQRVAPGRSACKYIDPAQIEAMQCQIDAACAFGLALDKQAQDVQSELTEARHKVKQLKEWGNMDYKVQALTQQINKAEAKRARLAQQSANAYAKAARIRAQIDKIMLSA